MAGLALAHEMSLGFAVRDIDEYMQYAADIAEPVALELHGLSEDECAALRSQLEDASAPLSSEGVFALPGLGLRAVAVRAPA